MRPSRRVKVIMEERSNKLKSNLKKPNPISPKLHQSTNLVTRLGASRIKGPSCKPLLCPTYNRPGLLPGHPSPLIAVYSDC